MRENDGRSVGLDASQIANWANVKRKGKCLPLIHHLSFVTEKRRAVKNR